jgi:hypothetical protein
VFCGAAAALGLTLSASAAGCNWDKYDPRVGAGVGGGGAQAGSGGSSSSVGGGSSGGSGGAAACNGIGLLNDDFELDGRDTVWVESDGSSKSDTAETNGELVITLGDDYSPDAGYASRYYYDLTDSAIAVEVKQTPNATDPNARTQLVAVRDSGRSIRLVIRNGMLYAQREINNTNADVVPPVPYDPVAQRWLKLRQEAGTVFWEVSPDGNSYAAAAELPAASVFPLDLVRIWIESIGTNYVGGQAVFDNVRGTSAAGATVCPAKMLVDDFSSDEPSSAWLFAGWDSTTVVHRANGRLAVAFGLNVTDANFAYVSSLAYDLTDDFFALETVQRHSNPGALYLRVSDESDSMDIVVTDDALECILVDEGSTLMPCMEPYDAVEHRWLRIRDGEDKAYWERSADGISWSEMASSSPTPIRVDRVQLRMGGSTPMPNPTPGILLLDNVNRLPAP